MASSLQPRPDFGRDAWRDADLLDLPPRVLRMRSQEPADVTVEHRDIRDQPVRAALAASEPDATVGFAQSDEIDFGIAAIPETVDA